MLIHISIPKDFDCKKFWYSLLLLLLSSVSTYAQIINEIIFKPGPGLTTDSISLSDSAVLSFTAAKPFFSFVLDGKYCSSADYDAVRNNGSFLQTVNRTLKISVTRAGPSAAGYSGEIIFENTGTDTVTLSNVVPFGEDSSAIYITGFGPADLARASLFRPGFRPVRVILPDNAWELGYSSFMAGNGISMCALARRTGAEGSQKKRYETALPPGSKVSYTIYVDLFRGEWQEGLRLMFRDRYLHDLEKFDNSLYQRTDLAWIRESYLIILQMAWDREFYDRQTGQYKYPELLRKGIEYFGNIDVYGIWPTWPRLGLDKRNQWDMYRDLPGGTAQLRSFARLSRPYGTKFFIAYNPWDNSTRKEDHLRGMATLIGEIEADGVVLDTRGSSSYELQATADNVRKGVVMYSEGMPVIKDMPGILAARVHNAIYLSPELNLNKLIKPDFAIFRVCDIGEDIIHREIAIAFFNGYGTELNMYRPGGRDENFEADLDFLARTTFILRQNNDAFLDTDWTPLIETSVDSVFVNRWKSEDKMLYTVLNMKPEGFAGKLFKVSGQKERHFFSLWNHENILPETENGSQVVKVRAEGWPSVYAGTRREGSVDCIAEFPDILKSKLKGDSIMIPVQAKGRITIWKGNPSYKTEHKEFKIVNDTVISVRSLYGYFEGKLVIQLIDEKRLVDENILMLEGGKPWLISRIIPTRRVVTAPPGMVLVPGDTFSFNVTTTEEFMPYPDISGRSVVIDSFLIDKYPVTNAEYYEFLLSSGYQPVDTTRYLKHWESGIMFKQGQDKYPVVCLSYEDMTAYANWADKRLPTEAEWQLAAQGKDRRKWPWGNEFHATNCNNAFDRPTPVDAFSKGQSPYGVMDMVGNIWQLTGDMYFNGSYYLRVIRGGSYYRPDSSLWYIQGGPQPLDRTQIMLLVSPGFDRSETVGFRCVKDIDGRNFKGK
jgi:formylglycine-generating enzyme required for sulfatase activity